MRILYKIKNLEKKGLVEIVKGVKNKKSPCFKL